jgi:hypothetical protein
MWIRSAFWVGVPRSGSENGFRDAVNLELVPALRKLPAVRGAKALWPERLEDTPPNIFCQILVEFDGREGVDEMLASEERKALRSRVREIAGMFDGAISHIDYRVA